MPDQRGIKDKGATMRLGAYPCTIKPDSLAAQIYGTTKISERHRHRYEVNNEYREQLEQGGLVLCGVSPDERLVEMVELPGHPHFVGCQFHPEFKSKPHLPHPLFTSFVRAAVEHHAQPGPSGRRRNRGARQLSLLALSSQLALRAPYPLPSSKMRRIRPLSLAARGDLDPFGSQV